MVPSSAFTVEEIDSDGDGVPNNVDFCPHLLEDYDLQYGNNIDGCPADFVPWYDADYDGIQDHLDNCPTVKETYNKFQDEDGCPDLSSGDTKGTADTDDDGFPDFMEFMSNSSRNFQWH